MNELPTMTPDQMAELAARLRVLAARKAAIAFVDQDAMNDATDLYSAADLIAGMAQRVPLTVDRIEELANQHNANLWRYHAYEQDAIIRLIRAVECEHGIVDRQEDAT